MAAKGKSMRTTRVTKPESEGAGRTTHKDSKPKVKAMVTSVEAEERTKRRSGKPLAKTRKVRKIEAKPQPEIRRVSFIVRLTWEEPGGIKRTEIEYVENQKKQNFLSLDGEQLVTFMKTCLQPEPIMEDSAFLSPPEDATPPAREVRKPDFRLICSEVRTSRIRDPERMTLILEAEEPFIACARFQIERLQTQSTINLKHSYKIRIYANDLTSGKSQLLRTYNAELFENVMQYLVPISLAGLPSGFYRLFTLITLAQPHKLATFYDGPVVHVI